MKLAFVTDTHLMPVGTRYRVDEYEDAIFCKLQHMVAVCLLSGVKVVLHGGDVFDLQGPRGVPRELIYRLQEFVASSGLSWIFVAGQHDFRGRDPSTARSAPLSLLRGHEGVLHCETHEPTTTVSVGDTHILCLQYTLDIEARLRHLASEAGDGQPPDIILVHAPILERPAVWGGIPAASLDGLPAKMVLSGDYHGRLGPLVVGGKWGPITFYNPGALSRVDSNEAERPPAFGIVDPLSGTVEHIELPHAEGTAAFDLTQAANEKIRHQARTAFADRLSTLERTEETNDWETLSVNLKEEDPNIVNLARKYFMEAARASVPT